MLKNKVTTVDASDSLISNTEAEGISNVNRTTLHTTEGSEGAVRNTLNSTDLLRQMGLAESIMHADREILRALAK